MPRERPSLSMSSRTSSGNASAWASTWASACASAITGATARGSKNMSAITTKVPSAMTMPDAKKPV
jgi:hypothetical protein